MVKSRSRPALLECLEFPLQTDEPDSSWCGGFTIGEDDPCHFFAGQARRLRTDFEASSAVCPQLWFIIVFIKGSDHRVIGGSWTELLSALLPFP